MRTLLCTLLVASAAWADPPDFVPSYSFQGPKSPPRATYQFSSHRAPSYQQLSGQRSSYRPRQAQQQALPPIQPVLLNQRAVPESLSNWGGTVVESAIPGSCTITSNGKIPAGSLVGIGHGDRFLGQARVVTASSGGAQLATQGNFTLSPGDWVSVLSVPAPPPQPYSGSNRYQTAYHSSSTNADPTYQRWLRQGFTMGGFHHGSMYSSGFSGSYRCR